MIQTLSEALERQGYTTLTPVQEAVTEPELEQCDLLVSAQTGSGKTVGFGLAIAPTLLGEAQHLGQAAAPLALIIAPTRELALQVRRELTWLYENAGARVTSCVGGMDMRDERRALERGAHIVVATPGRLRDHIQRGSLDMSDLRAVVLDEADEMLDLGFREDLEFILSEAPESRRTLMFSATVPRAIASLAASYQKDAIRITTTAETSQHADIEYRALNVDARDTENAIINVLRFYEAKNAIVFCNTRAMVNRLTTRFTNRGFSVVALSGELTQSERSHALQAMRDGRARVCVATDVAARGIDLPNLELVIHADLPSSPDTLLHRSGRTGRAGRKGVSALIVPAKARRKAERLLKIAKLTATWANPPSAQEVLERDEARILGDESWTQPVRDEERGFIDQLTERFSAQQLAAAYMRLRAANHSAPEELARPSDKPEPRPREAFGPGVWFSVSAGRNRNVEPRWLLPLLCRMGDISKDDIGAIRIQPDETYVEILETSAAGFVAALGPDLALEDGMRVSQLEKAPDLARRDTGKPAGPAKKPHRGGPDRKRAYGKDSRPAPKPDQKPFPKKERKPTIAEPYKAKPPAEKPAKPKPAPARNAQAKAAEKQGKPERKAAPKRPAGNAADPSQRVGPGGKPGRKPGKGASHKPRAGKTGAAKPKYKSKGDSEGGRPASRGKPRFAKGGDAVPRRGKGKPAR
ncbi:MAG: DEAD/DEAH box helicase [Paracoccaceae bacterium]